MGYDDDASNRAVWIADSGFRPFGYWISFDQFATLIPPKGYAYSTAAAAVYVPPVKGDPVADLTARVDSLTRTLTTLLKLIETQNPELLRAYLEATKGS
jgi:hypothetical protein